MRSRRTVLGFLVLVVWAGMVAWQIRREYFQPELTRLLAATVNLAPGTNFYTIQMDGRAVGLATSRLDTIPTGFLLDDLLSLELQALGQSGGAVMRTQVQLSPALQMERFSFSLDSEGGRFSAEGTVTGDTLLQVTLDAGGGVQNVTHRLSEAPIFSSVLPIRVAMGEQLQVGARYRYPIFDPSTLSTRTVEVEVMEEARLPVVDSAFLDEDSGRWLPASVDSVDAWRLQESYGGMQIESWVDGDGRIVRSASALGFTMERTQFELAQQAQDEDEGMPFASSSDVIFQTAIQSNRDLGEVENHQELRFLLSGVDLEGFDLDGHRQELRGDTLIVRREAWNQLTPDYQLPYPRMDLREALVPEPLIQSDDPRILAAAQSAAGSRRRGGGDPREVAARLSDWVYRALDKNVVFSIPSALQVLESRAGDCNEHTVLYVAMARALGLPARTAVGLVYLNGDFFYHAWPEVWLGEWVAVDPTFGQAPADAAHLRFVTGGLAQQVEIIRLIGNLNIEVLDMDEGVAGP